jgi:ribonuclease Z
MRQLGQRAQSSEAGMVFSRTKPKLAAYTHLVFLASERTPPATLDDLVAETRQTYGGPLRSARI